MNNPLGMGVFLLTNKPPSVPAMLSQSHVRGLVIHPDMYSFILPAYSGETGSRIRDWKRRPLVPRVAAGAAVFLDSIRLRLYSSVRYVT
jgi:hypothetical protein